MLTLRLALSVVVWALAVRSQLAAQTMLASAPMTLAESAKFFEAETLRYRAIANQIQLQPQ